MEESRRKDMEKKVSSVLLFKVETEMGSFDESGDDAFAGVAG